MANYIVGLTGGIGSGKTTVSTMFAEKGITIVDADIVAREVVEPNCQALINIAQHFGDEILLANGQLNRSLLRSKVFADEHEKQWLNNLLHPLIRARILAQLSANAGDYCILSAPLLFENNLQQFVNRKLVIDVSVATQLARTCLRDKSNESEVMAIIDSQIARDKRLLLADDVIDNETSDLASVQAQVDQLDHQYKMLSTSSK